MKSSIPNPTHIYPPFILLLYNQLLNRVIYCLLCQFCKTAVMWEIGENNVQLLILDRDIKTVLLGVYIY